MNKLKIGNLIYNWSSFLEKTVLYKDYKPDNLLEFFIEDATSINRNNIQEELDKTENTIIIFIGDKTYEKKLELIYFWYDEDNKILSFKIVK